MLRPPLNPDAVLLTELWSRSMDDREPEAQRQAQARYFACLKSATSRAAALHLAIVRARLQSRKGF